MKCDLKPLSEKEISNLPKLLEQYLPSSAVPFNVVQLHLQNRHNVKHLKAKFYSCTKFMEQSLFLVCILEKTYEETEIVVFTPESPSAESLERFESLVDWKTANTFASTNGPITEKVKEMCSRNGRITETVFCKFNVVHPNAHLNELDTSATSKNVLKTGNTVLFRPLSSVDAQIVTSKWKYAREDTVIEVVDIIEKIASFGVYLDSELVSWILMNQIGTVGSLYTLEKYRGKGYAEVVARNITKVATEMGLIPTAEMEFENQSSFKLFHKIGYDYALNSEWVCYSPNEL